MKALITGASGGLGRYVWRVATELGWTTLTPTHSTLDLTQPDAISSYLKEHAPDVVLHLAALANVDRCQKEPQVAVQLNVSSTLHLARLAKKVVYMSTNDVFSELLDAGVAGPYSDETVPAPGNTYTWSKYAAEQAVLATGGAVVRANFFTRHCRAKESFAAYVLRNTIERRLFDCYINVIACPVFAETLANIFCSFVTSTGVFHVGTTDAVNRLDQARAICRAYGLSGSFAQDAILENRAGRPLDARLIPSACIEPLYVHEEVAKMVAAEPL